MRKQTCITAACTYHGPIPMFGMAVGAMIPLTSCWIILCKEETMSYVLQLYRDGKSRWYSLVSMVILSYPCFMVIVKEKNEGVTYEACPP